MQQTTIAGRARNGYRARSLEIRITKTIAMESGVPPTRIDAVAIARRIHVDPVGIGIQAIEQVCARVKLSVSVDQARA